MAKPNPLDVFVTPGKPASTLRVPEPPRMGDSAKFLQPLDEAWKKWHEEMQRFAEDLQAKYNETLVAVKAATETANQAVQTASERTSDALTPDQSDQVTTLVSKQIVEYTPMLKDKIQADESVLVPVGYTMLVPNPFEVAGTLEIAGTLIAV